MGKKLDQIKDEKLEQVSGGVLLDTTLITKGVDDLVHNTDKSTDPKHTLHTKPNTPLGTVQNLRGETADVSGGSMDSNHMRA